MLIVINESNILRDKKYYPNLNEMSKYKEIEEIKRKNEIINEITIDNIESEVLFERIASIPKLNILTIKNRKYFYSDFNCDLLLKISNVNYIEVENVLLEKKELDKLVELIEKGILSPNIIKEYFKKYEYDRILHTNRICKKILSNKKISKRVRIAVQKINQK